MIIIIMAHAWTQLDVIEPSLSDNIVHPSQLTKSMAKTVLYLAGRCLNRPCG